jgi:hypothetical protein
LADHNPGDSPDEAVTASSNQPQVDDDDDLWEGFPLDDTVFRDNTRKG